MKINTTEIIKFAVMVAVATAGAVYYVPTTAQEKVDDHVTKVETPHEEIQDKALVKIDAKAEANDKAIQEVRLEQVKMKGELIRTREKLTETDKLLTQVLAELRRNR